MKIKIMDTIEIEYIYQFLGSVLFISEPIVEVDIQNKRDISKSGYRSTLYDLYIAVIAIPINATRNPISPKYFLIIFKSFIFVQI